MIVAQFIDYAAAHRALCELIHTGILPNDIGIVAGERSNGQGANRELGILETDAERYLRVVRRGRTLLAVEADEAAWAQVLAIIEHHAPVDIEEVAGTEALPQVDSPKKMNVSREDQLQSTTLTPDFFEKTYVVDISKTSL